MTYYGCIKPLGLLMLKVISESHITETHKSQHLNATFATCKRC